MSKKILIVDDSLTVRMYHKQILHKKDMFVMKLKMAWKL